MEEVSLLYGKMPKQLLPETGLMLIGIVIIFFVLLALVVQYLEVPASVTSEKFFLTPYLKFAYACFIKPHAQENGGQQSALENFYSTQVSRTIG